MPLYRDSKDDDVWTLVDGNGEAEDISARELRVEYFQPQTCQTVTLAMGSGIAFVTDGTDGQVSVTLTKDQVNQFCPGSVRCRVFDDQDSDPVLLLEGGDTVEGKGFDA